MAAARASIVCYYDLISPYTYMGFKLFNRFRKQWPNVDVTFRPMLLGGVMNEIKNQPLFAFPSKKSHMIADLDRISKVTGVPFTFPQKFPINTVLPMRVLTALQVYEAEKYEQCIDKDEYFINGRDISQADIISQALSPIFSTDTTKIESYLQRASQDQEIKKMFKQYTDEAIAKGVFGAPTFLVRQAGAKEGEEMLFFGSDRFEMMAATLGVPYAGLTSVSKL
ncbi:Glutathione S-transferase kappa 1 [Linnemannia exigua]|uniref:Glutathione S-transferase kappa n=1 Tax=Linnemannia exigua TaxID=604196 RepID=A0AAD4H9L9_9FUNG|nr:Glutathione S-transferase kappa 1 [Linnemannia exigua]